jgi:lipopolysaccharide transport system ATP-binding protein
LIVDEVLAVGDAGFQKKCLGKMEDVGKEGRTVIFVSHNMGAIKALCSRGIFLSSGSLITDSHIDTAIHHYNQNFSKKKSSCYQTSKVSQLPHFQKVEVYQKNKKSNPLYIDEPIYIDFDIESANKNNLFVGLVIRNSLGIWVHHSSDEFSSEKELGSSKRRCEIPTHGLSAGTYYIDLFLGIRNYNLYEKIEDAVSFEVDFSDSTHAHTSSQDWKGICGPGILVWS